MTILFVLNKFRKSDFDKAPVFTNSAFSNRTFVVIAPPQIGTVLIGIVLFEISDRPVGTVEVKSEDTNAKPTEVTMAGKLFHHTVLFIVAFLNTNSETYLNISSF